MTEGNLWRWLTDRLPPGDYTRIESPCSPGLPDVSYALSNNVQGWIELKIGGPGQYPMRGARRGLKPAQVIWQRNRVSLGVPCLIIAYIGPTFVVWRLKPTQFTRFNDWNRDELLCNATYCIPRAKMRLLPVSLLT